MQKFKLMNFSEIKELFSSLKIIPQSFRIFFNASRSTFIVSLILTVVAGIIPVISARIFGYLINTITDMDFKSSMKMLLFYIGISYFSDTISSIQSFFSTKFQYFLDYELTKKLMNKCSNMTLEEFEDSDIQDQIQHIQSQITFRPYSIFTSVLSMITSITTIISSVFLIIIWKPWAILFIIVPVTIFSLFNLSISKREFQTEEKNAKKARSIWYYEFLITKDQSFKEVKIFNLANYFIKKHNGLKKSVINENLFNSKIRMIISIFFDLVDQICIAILITLIIITVVNGKLLIGGAVALLRIIGIVFDNFNNTMNIFYSINQNSLYMTKVINFLNPKESLNKSHDGYLITNIDKIEFKNVDFFYPGSDKKVLDNINIKINKGDKIALFGSNGSGKTTLIKLLMGYYLVSKGSITINGISINDINIDSLYKLTGILFQDYSKYEFTVRDNVGFGNIEEIDNDLLLKKALEKSDISFLYNSLDQQLGKWFSDGIQLSGGQWQRVALARCFFRKADLYILDEPNSSLDKKGEDKIMNAFFELIKNNIGIFVSHKIAHSMLADKIFYLDSGKIVAVGTHEELLDSCPSYKEIYDLEFNIATQ